MGIKSNMTESFLNVTSNWPFSGGTESHWLFCNVSLAGESFLGGSGRGTDTSKNPDTDCRCAVLRAPAGVLKVSRNFKQSDLLLVIPPQAEGRVHSIRVMHPPCRHKRFVPQHLFERREQVTALLMQLLARRLLPGIGSGSGLPGGEH